MWPKFPIERALIVLAALASGACRQDMHDSPRLEPLEKSSFFSDGRASRHPVEGTVARGQLNSDLHLHEGRRILKDPSRAGEEPETELVDELPYEVTRNMLVTGRERYEIFCTPCHARTGNGDGMVVRRGFQQPPSLHDDKIRSATLGHLYEVIRRGIGAMPGYGAQIPVDDRWAIVAYIRALQLSQRATIADVPPFEKRELEKEAP
jgi:hypothetical protein